MEGEVCGCGWRGGDCACREGVDVGRGEGCGCRGGCGCI